MAKVGRNKSFTESMSLKRLKPCPKCGGQRIWLANENMRMIEADEMQIDKPKWQFYCGACDYQGPFEQLKLQAKTAWNRLERRK